MMTSVFVGTSVDGFIARLNGEGIPLFGSLPHDVRLRHVATRDYPSGLVQSEYQVIPGDQSRGASQTVPLVPDVR
jgi:hypothetical protein